MQILMTLAVYTQAWKELFGQYFEFGFKPQDVRFTLKLGDGSPKPILFQLSRKLYEILRRAAEEEGGDVSEAFQDFSAQNVPGDGIIVQVPNIGELAKNVQYAIHLSLSLLKREKDERIRKTKKEIDRLVHCMLEDGPKIWTGDSFYKKGHFYIPYAVGRNKYSAKGKNETEVIENFQKILDQLPDR